jgi:hypothetical protein
MRCPQHLRTLYASTACYGDSVTLLSLRASECLDLLYRFRNSKIYRNWVVSLIRDCTISGSCFLTCLERMTLQGACTPTSTAIQVSEARKLSLKDKAVILTYRTVYY